MQKGHETGKAVGQLRQELWRIGVRRVASILSGETETLAHQD
jgi:hypothetical protein